MKHVVLPMDTVTQDARMDGGVVTVIASVSVEHKHVIVSMDLAKVVRHSFIATMQEHQINPTVEVAIHRNKFQF